MPIYSGSTAIGSLNIGGTAIARVYVGSAQVFQAGAGGWSEAELDADEATWIDTNVALAIGRAVITQNGTGGTGAVFDPAVFVQKRATDVAWGGEITSTSLTPSVAAASIAAGDVTLDAVIWSLLDLRLYGQGVTACDISDFTRMTHLRIYTNPITSLDASNNTALVLLYCLNSSLTTLDLPTSTTLQTMWCDTNQLTALDVSTITAVKSLFCHVNKLTQASLDGILADLDTHGVSNGTLKCETQTNAGGAAVINTGSAAATSAQNLINRGWALTYSGTFNP